MGKWRERYASALAIILLALVIIIKFPDTSSGSPDAMKGAMDPEIWVETESDTYSFKVEPGHADEGVIIGTLFCEFQTGTPRGTKVTVDMVIMGNSLNYRGSVMHTFIKGSEEDPIDFSIDLLELAGLPADLEYSLVMYPNWYNTAANRQGMGEQKTVEIDILPYGGVLVIPPNPQTFEVGQTHRIDISIKNLGNSRAKFHVNVEAEDLEILIPNLVLIIEPGKVETYPVDVKQDSGLGKEGEIKVTASSEVPGDHDSETIHIHYDTHTSVGNFMLRPIPLVITIVSIILVIVSIVVLVKKIRGSASRT